MMDYPMRRVPKVKKEARMDLRSAVVKGNKLRERDIYMKLNTKEVENWLCRTVMRVIPICKENKEISM